MERRVTRFSRRVTEIRPGPFNGVENCCSHHKSRGMKSPIQTIRRREKRALRKLDKFWGFRKVHSEEAIKCKRQLLEFVEDVARKAWNDSLKVGSNVEPKEYADSISAWVDAKISEIVKFAGDNREHPEAAPLRRKYMETVEDRFTRMFYAPRAFKSR